MLQTQLLSFALIGAEWVLWLLVALSVVCVAVAAERFIYSALNRTPQADLHGALQPFLAGGEASPLIEKLAGMKGIEARVLEAGARAAQEGGAEPAEAAMAGVIAMEKLGLERGLLIIGTVGANAPFIGLFGTVLGIIRAFNDLSLETAEAAGAVMSGISEALVATAIGLMVAIPAVVLYNWFGGRNKAVLARVESLAQLMVARFMIARAHHPERTGG